jgi:hypothetical protein
MSKYLLVYKFASIATGCALSGFLALGPVYAAPAPAPAPHRIPSIHRAPSIHSLHHGVHHGTAHH